MRLSQAQFADALRAAGNAMGAPNRCTKRLVQKWETGEHVACRQDYLRVLQAVTGLSARELGFRVLPDESGQSAAVDATTAATPDGDTSAADALGTSGVTQPASAGTIEEAMDRLRYALDHPATVDSRTADIITTATARLFDLEHYSPARLLAPTVERHLARVTTLLVTTRNASVKQKLMVSAGRSALLAGWLAFDRGDLASAHRLWDSSIAAAEGTMDNELLAATLTYESYAASRRGDPGTAWRLAHSAAEHTPDDPRATAWSTSRAALYAAQLGEREAAEEAMVRAIEVGENLPSPKPGDGGAPWTRFFDLPELLSSTAHTAALLKNPDAADYATQAVSALVPAKVKANAVVLAEAALTAALVGELGLCLEWGSSAATLARELAVSTATDLLHEVLPILLEHSDTRAVRELLPQLTHLTRSADLEDEAEQEE